MGRCDELDNRRESSVDNDKREDPGNDKSRRNDVTHGQWVAMGRDYVAGPVFSLPSRLADGDVRHCAIRRGPLSTSVPALYSQTEPALTAGRVCRDYARTPGPRYRRVLRAAAMTISSLMPARTFESETNVTYGDERDRR